MSGMFFPFRAGDRVPDLQLPDVEGRPRKLLWAFQGEPVALLALADGRAIDSRMADIVAAARGLGATCAVVVGAPPAVAGVALAEAGLGGEAVFTLCDPDRRFLRPMLAPDAAQGASAAAVHDRRVMLLDANQRLVAQFAGMSMDAIRAGMRDAVALARAERPADSLHVGSAAPVMILPRVFEPEFRAALIELWHAGERGDGGVASRYGNVVSASRKQTEDHIVTDPAFVRQIFDRLAYRVGPELAKGFGWDRQFGFDAPVIISYAAEARHFFGAHRDNNTPQSADRAFAVSLNLNEGFEGGELVFPEYGPTRFRPGAGAAAIFSCSLLHEALPVTSGRRFVLTTFFRDRGPATPKPG
ncbi:MAG: 2OG-Fe(II) oxygenase [Rhodospirillales bacterium]|nr:MAG: 2OG-Fe(II) oxygenase [Rhodospirillales bacterium]